MRSPFSIKWIYLIERRSFGQKYKFSNKNDMVSTWRNFKNIFSRPLFTITFRPEMLKFHPYSILTGDSMVGFVIFCVLRNIHCWLMTSQFQFKTTTLKTKLGVLGGIINFVKVGEKKLQFYAIFFFEFEESTIKQFFSSSIQPQHSVIVTPQIRV